MEMALSNGFSEMSFEEMMHIDGGIKKALALTGGCLLIAAGGVTVMVGLGGGIGTGGSALAPGLTLASSGLVAIYKGVDVVFGQ